MKRKIMALALTVVLGMSVFGGSVQAAVKTGCTHKDLEAVEIVTVYGYEKASGLFHLVMCDVKYKCKSCGLTAVLYDEIIEDHDFTDYRDGWWYCKDCGEEDLHP